MRMKSLDHTYQQTLSSTYNKTDQRDGAAKKAKRRVNDVERRLRFSKLHGADGHNK
jgi:hypothetical protein